MIGIIDVVDRLVVQHGEPGPPPAPDPFHQIVWINCAYLVSDDRRRQCFVNLMEEVGLEPSDLEEAGIEGIAAAISSGGKSHMRQAEKLFTSAMIALENDNQLLSARILKTFPGVSSEVAAVILTAAGEFVGLPLESNGLKILGRLGFGTIAGNYAKDLRAVKADLHDLPEDASWAWRAHTVLRTHGRQICKNSAPLCDACTLEDACIKRGLA